MAAEYVRAARDDRWRMKVTENTRAQQQSVSKGEIIDLPVDEALELMRSGKAERYIETPKPAVPEKVEAVKPPVNADAKTDEAVKEKPKEKPTEATKGGK